MTGASVILIFFGIFAAAVVGTIAVFFGRIVWAMRNPEKFKQFQERETAAANERKLRAAEAERERIRLGKPSWGGRFFGFIFLIAGVSVLIYGVWGFYDLARAQTWERAECTIVSAAYDQNSSKNITTYYPKIRYAYNFQGRQFTGERFDLVRNYYDWAQIKRLLEDYPRGRQLACYVNQSNPQEAVLTRNPLQYPFFRVGIGLVLCFGLSGILFYTSRRRKPQKSPENLNFNSSLQQ